MIVIRTHGGLGNQLFQIVFGLALASWHEEETVCRIHDNRIYKVKRAPTPLFADLDRPVSWIASIGSSMRIPKILWAIGVRQREFVRFGRLWMIDGYFQSAADWRGLPSQNVRAVIEEVRRRLNIGPAVPGSCLVHLRLGDFFASEQDERAHVRDRLKQVPEGAVLMTDRDDLLSEYAADLARMGVRHIQTAAMTPEALLSAMAEFADIRSNDSTISFWAALLGGGTVTLKLPRLIELMATLRRLAA